MPSSFNYDMIAIDLDGTLLCSKGEVSRANIDAIRDARDAGITVTICTGRGLLECRHVTTLIDQQEPVVVAGGSILACPVRQRTIHRFAMSADLVRGLVDRMTSHGHAALVLKDPTATALTPSGIAGCEGDASPGHDYVVVSPDGWRGVDPVTRWWFETLKVPVKLVASLDEDDHLDHTVRVGVCGTRAATEPLAREVLNEYNDRVNHHHFGAVVPEGITGDPDKHVVIFELFDRLASKWSAIEWLAGQRQLRPERICAIGNDVNDVDMLARAGLGIAMGNAIPEARAAARMHTHANDADGVAHAIRQVLDGKW
jgi:hydroxymethylpyrimidine pyrophosphatase-like HAD family hydrolase